MKIGLLGTGTWGFCLGALLAEKGHQVVAWSKNRELAELLAATRQHPRLPQVNLPEGMQFTSDLHEALNEIEFLVESVTTAGVRSVFSQVKPLLKSACPIVVSSKGIEQNSLLTLPEVIIELLGDEIRPMVGCLSGPSYAHEVIRGLPTSVVGAAFDYDTMLQICELFTTSSFRVYPNSDIKGVAYGGALKNIIAIACGISDGLELGNSSKAALMTRGLHEIRKLSVARGCRPETFSGLSGMGDICLTCGSLNSRNSRFGYLIAQGMTPSEAEKKIEMVVEGAYTSVSALQIGRELEIPMPITEAVYQILYKGLPPMEAVRQLMQRTIKEEHL